MKTIKIGTIRAGTDGIVSIPDDATVIRIESLISSVSSCENYESKLVGYKLTYFVEVK